MSNVRLHPFSLLAGLALATIVFLGLGQAAASPTRLEYKIVDDVTEKELRQLSDEGWEFAGYLGQSTRGTSSDETLWKRPAK